jgi:hypothetical protein
MILVTLAMLPSPVLFPVLGAAAAVFRTEKQRAE